MQRFLFKLLLVATGCSLLQAAENDLQISQPGRLFVLTDPNTVVLSSPKERSAWITDFFGSAAFADSKGEVYALHISFEENKPGRMRIAIQPFMGVSKTGTNEALITGIDALLKLPMYIKGKFSLDFEGGGGLQQTGKTSFPESGTHFNFRSFCGLSMRFGTPEKNTTIFGIRYIHSSNGGISTPNPGVDNLMLYTGFQVRF